MQVKHKEEKKLHGTNWKRKKLHGINKWIKRKNSGFTHLNGSTYEYKLDYSSANSIYVFTIIYN